MAVKALYQAMTDELTISLTGWAATPKTLEVTLDLSPFHARPSFQRNEGESKQLKKWRWYKESALGWTVYVPDKEQEILDLVVKAHPDLSQIAYLYGMVTDVQD